MSEDPGPWVQFGIKIPDLVAGFFGGVVNAFIMKRSDPWSIIGSLVVGTLTANYLSETISHYLGTGQGPTGFLVGIGGMAICQGALNAAKSWKPFGPHGNGVKNDGSGS